MTNKKPVQFLYPAMACLLLLLTSCDGGLFGTGDGTNNDNIMVDGEADGATGGTQSGVDAGTDGTTTGTTDGETTADSMSVASDSNPTTEAFDNMLPGSQIAAPQMRVLNFTQLNVQISANNNAVVNELQPEQDSGRFELPVDATQLTFADFTALSADDSSVAFHTIEPFNAAEFSITTIIMRQNDIDGSISVITLTTQSEPTDPTTALARLVQTTSLGDVSRSSTITLAAAEPLNSGSDVSFEGLSFDTQATGYADILPGTYTLIDAANRFASQSITIEANHVYTIVINRDTAPVLRVIDESQ